MLPHQAGGQPMSLQVCLEHHAFCGRKVEEPLDHLYPMSCLALTCPAQRFPLLPVLELVPGTRLVVAQQLQARSSQEPPDRPTF